ncbi:MAG: YIP1 family protein [Candidatus Latescibacterota bacterium]
MSNRLGAPCAAVLAACCLLAPAGAGAGSGFVAYAAPVAGIAVDGSLNDWPADAAVWALDAVFKGSPGHDPEDPAPADLAAHFRVAWSPQEQRVCVALVVRDDRLTLGSGITNTDVCELYLDADGSGGPASPQQFLMFPGDASYNVLGGSGNPALSGGDIQATGAQGTWAAAGDSLVYEWSLSPGRGSGQGALPLAPGMRLGLDLAAVDKDEKARGPTWLSWSPGPSKVANPERLGELVLLASQEEARVLGRVRVRVVQPGSEGAWRGITVQAQRDGRVLAAAVSGPEGRLELVVPPGLVHLSVPEADPPAERQIACPEAGLVEVELPVARRRGPVLPRWPFAVALGLCGGIACAALYALGRRAALVGGVLARPAETFAYLARQPEWAGPAAMAVAGAALAASAGVGQLPGELWGALMGIPGGLATGIMLTVPVLLFVVYLVVAFASWLAWGACLWTAARLAGHRCRLLPLTSIVGYAGVPWLLGVSVAAVSAAWGWQGADPGFSRLCGLGLWAEQGTPAGEVLARLEVFSLWTFALGVVGTSRLLPVPWPRAVALNGGCWAVYLGAVYAYHAVSRALAAVLTGGAT